MAGRHSINMVCVFLRHTLYSIEALHVVRISLIEMLKGFHITICIHDYCFCCSHCANISTNSPFSLCHYCYNVCVHIKYSLISLCGTLTF